MLSNRSKTHGTELKTKLPPTLILIAMVLSTNASAQLQENPEETPPARRQQTEVYHESALRRFEIVTLVALPFTAIHSFLGVRGIEMIRQKKVAPELSSTDFRIIGASAASLALLVGFWDWLHTHDKAPSQQLIPDSPPSTPPAEEEARREHWEFKDSPAVVVQLFHVRF